jgi:starch phosphorylase
VDAAESEALYTLIEREIVPKFYQRDQQGIPTQWIAMMRESMARLTPVFSANRVVREYTEKHYLPGAAAYCSRAAEHGKSAKELLEWQRTLNQNWSNIHFGQVHVDTHDGQHVFKAEVHLNDVNADAVRVELYAESPDGVEPIRQAMERGAENTYSATVPATRPASDFTPRVVPFKAGAFIPLEANHILWR